MVNFGVPSKRKAREEFYPGAPVIKMRADEGEGTTKKFELNTKASELLGITDSDTSYVSVSFEGGIHIANTTSLTDVERYKVTKNKPYTFSNKKLYTYIIKLFDLDTDTDYFFEITGNTTEEDITLYTLSLYGVGLPEEEVEEYNNVEEVAKESIDFD